MAGGLLQLIYVGAQNAYLTNNPEITFFKTVYKRHTNFAFETVCENFYGAPNFGKKVQCTISKRGDLLKSVTLNVKLPSLNSASISGAPCVCGCCPCCVLTPPVTTPLTYGWANSIGHVLIEYAEIHIGGQVIDKQFGEWLEIWVELTQPAEKVHGYNMMVGRVDQANFSVDTFKDEQDLYIPLNFWFCRNVGLSLPLISLQYHTVDIYIKFRDLSECWVANQANAPTPLHGLVTMDAYILCDYIYLDLGERHKFAQNSHFYLIEQVQSTFKSFDINVGNPRIDIDFNHPVKQLVWLVQRSDITGKANGLIINGNTSYPAGNDWFNYSISKIPWLACGKESFVEASLNINGDERVPFFPAKYYRCFLPYFYQTRIPQNYIYTYNFALKPEDFQPTGTCNWSRIETAQLLLKVKFPVDHYGYSVRIYGTNYNWLLITDGLGSLLFID